MVGSYKPQEVKVAYSATKSRPKSNLAIKKGALFGLKGLIMEPEPSKRE